MCYKRKCHDCEQSEAQRSSKKIQKSASEVLPTRKWQQECCLPSSPQALYTLRLRREDQTPSKAADPVTAEERLPLRPGTQVNQAKSTPLSILFPALSNIHQGFHKSILFFVDSLPDSRCLWMFIGWKVGDHLQRPWSPVGSSRPI